MQQRKERIAFLLDVYTAKKASVEEEQELMDWLQETQEDVELQAYVQQVWDRYTPVAVQEEKVNWDRMFNNILSAEKKTAVRSISTRARSWKRMAVAATILLLIVAGAWWLFNKQNGKDDSLPAIVTKTDAKAPGSIKAIVSLPDGRKIPLDSLQQGLLAQQGNVQLVKDANGQLSYQLSTGTPGGEMQYNTLYNPKGSRVVHIMLADGTRVWLNAGSIITYPVAFMGKERNVEVNGEAYFEVAHNAHMPFHVRKGALTVQVLGTHFNVNAYDNETNIKVTLLEGSVKVSNEPAIGKRQSAILQPGQQAVLAAANSPFTIDHSPDLEQVMAWRDGMFLLENTDLAALMRQINRWYNVEVVYKSKIPAVTFGGGVSKDQPLSKILQVLEQYGVQSKLENNILTIQ